MSAPLLSVVIPVRQPSHALFERCIASLNALEAAPSIQVTLVHTGPFDRGWLERELQFHSVRLVDCETRGIYNAFNAGIGASSGRFLLFFGHDDIALPEMRDAIDALEGVIGTRTLIAGAVCIQGLGIRRPSRLRQAIVFRNWPHQGIFYSSALLNARSYDTSFPLRADHRLNIALLADKSVQCIRLSQVVSYFSRGGFSTVVVNDERFDAEQAAIAAAEFGRAWGIAVSVFLPVVRTLRTACRAAYAFVRLA